MASENPDIQEAVDVTLSFAGEMNEWESRVYFKSRLERGQSIHRKYQGL